MSQPLRTSRGTAACQRDSLQVEEAFCGSVGYSSPQVQGCPCPKFRLVRLSANAYRWARRRHTGQFLFVTTAVEQNVEVEGSIKRFLNSKEVAPRVDLVRKSEGVTRMREVGLLIWCNSSPELVRHRVYNYVWRHDLESSS